MVINPWQKRQQQEVPASPGRFEIHLDITKTQAGQTTVALLAGHTELSRQTIKQAMHKGAVWLTRKQGTRRIRRADKSLQSKDRLHLYYDPKVLSAEPATARLVVDEGGYSIWFKPFGMLSQGSKWGDHCTIGRWVETHLLPQRPAIMVHRLDRAAMGLMIVAHARQVAAAFTTMFEQRQLDKIYTAIVHGKVDAELTLSAPIDDKPAISHLSVLSYDASRDCSLVEVRIETGRKHQIRRHLADAGHAIVGDRLYGGREDASEHDLCLTASALSFVSPIDGVRKCYELPPELRLSLDTLPR